MTFNVFYCFVSFKNTMKFSLYFSILIITLAIKIATANIQLQRSPQQYCGSRLADIMKVLCKSNYNEKSKRNQIGKSIKTIK